LNRDPAAASELNPGLPVRLQEIIGKALEKDRGRRYQHAADIRHDLQALEVDLRSGGKHAGGPLAQGLASWTRWYTGVH
jgi:hypothetical protein